MVPKTAVDDGTPAESFVEQVKQSGDLEVAGASLVTLEDLQVQVPRGRYDVELCDKFMKLHGKTYATLEECWRALETETIERRHGTPPQPEPPLSSPLSSPLPSPCHLRLSASADFMCC